MSQNSRDTGQHFYPQAKQNERPAQPQKARYEAPHLSVLGNLCSVTLGGSPGFGDTGSGMNTQNHT